MPGNFSEYRQDITTQQILLAKWYSLCYNLQMLIQKLFDYQPLKRVDTENGRRYIVGEDRPLPSVTTILSKTKDMTHIKAWQDRVGIDEANKIKTEASNLGNGMHKNLENYILGNKMEGSFMSKTLANVIINKGLSAVSEVWGTEVSVYSKGLYAGTTDVVGVHNGIPSIIDFKNSLKDKKVEWITDYRAQLAAYALAHNEMYGTNIHRGVIMIATREANYQEFVFEDEEFDKCIDLWLDSLQKYYNMYPRDR